MSSPPNLEGLGPSPSPKSLPEGIPLVDFPIGKITFYLQQSKVFRNPNRMRIYIYAYNHIYISYLYIYVIHIVVILKYWSR
jgi:hypothetical protein